MPVPMDSQTAAYALGKRSAACHTISTRPEGESTAEPPSEVAQRRRKRANSKTSRQVLPVPCLHRSCNPWRETVSLAHHPYIRIEHTSTSSAQQKFLNSARTADFRRSDDAASPMRAATDHPSGWYGDPDIANFTSRILTVSPSTLEHRQPRRILPGAYTSCCFNVLVIRRKRHAKAATTIYHMGVQ